jgi:hypothetical protein
VKPGVPRPIKAYIPPLEQHCTVWWDGESGETINLYVQIYYKPKNHQHATQAVSVRGVDYPQKFNAISIRTEL